jgi:hypothetical protein
VMMPHTHAFGTGGGAHEINLYLFVRVLVCEAVGAAPRTSVSLLRCCLWAELFWVSQLGVRPAKSGCCQRLVGARGDDAAHARLWHRCVPFFE